MATAIERAAPNYDAAAVALVEAITKSEASIRIRLGLQLIWMRSVARFFRQPNLFARSCDPRRHVRAQATRTFRSA